MGKLSVSKSYSFVVTPNFSLMALSCAIDALRATNVTLGRDYYHWRVVSFEEDGPVESSCGLAPHAERFSAAVPVDSLVVCGGRTSDSYHNTGLFAAIRQTLAAGSRVGALSEASYILAAAGVLSDRRCTIHWKRQHAFREAYPDLTIMGSIFEIDDPVFTCAGGLASLDLFLRLIMEDHGPELAAKVAENFHHDSMRQANHSQRASSSFRHAGKSPQLVKALVLMEDNLEEPIAIREICERSNLSQRQIDRLFKSEFQSTPQSYYRDLRLQRAQQLLKRTNLTVSQIAAASGFASSSHLSRHFKSSFGTTPGSTRI